MSKCIAHSGYTLDYSVLDHELGGNRASPKGQLVAGPLDHKIDGDLVWENWACTATSMSVNPA